jgi:hypothetical protein
MAAQVCFEELRALGVRALDLVPDVAPQDALKAAAAVLAVLLVVYFIIDYIRASMVPTLQVELTEGDRRGCPNLGAILGKMEMDTMPYKSLQRVSDRERLTDALMHAGELNDSIDGDKYVPAKTLPKDRVPCYDPGNMQYLGDMPAMKPDEVRRACSVRHVACVVQLSQNA